MKRGALSRVSRETDEDPQRPSMASKARLYLAGAVALALAVAFGAFTIGWWEYSVSQRTAELSRQVVALASGLASSDVSPDEASSATGNRLMHVEAGLIGAGLFVTDSEGRVLRSTVATPPASLPIDRLDAGSTDDVRSGVMRTAAGTQVLVVAARVDPGRQLVAVQGLTEIRQAQRGLIILGVIALVAAGAVSFFAGGVLARRLTAPLVRLKSATEEVAAGALGTQVAEDGDRETVSLARSFNEMSTRVAATHEAQKMFVADVSHEIRTPLTSIRGFAEAMLDGTLDDEGERRQALGIIRDEAIRIGEVSGALLTLSELDAGVVEVRHVPVDLVLLADALKGRFASARKASAALELDFGPEPRPLGDPDRLLQVVSALVDNAIRHTPKDGVVRVGSRKEACGYLLTVEDSGPGIPEDQREAVFDRFAKSDDSRHDTVPGHGLGLAICRRLTELMHGSISVTSSALGGARFEIRLPLAERPLDDQGGA